MTDPPHRMPADSALSLLAALHRAAVDSCVGGGWAVDALVGEQTREHSDLDLWVLAADLDPLIRVVAGRGLDRLLPWGGDRPWNFVLHDGAGLRVDLHLYETLPASTDVHYGSVTTGEQFPADWLAGAGRIAGEAVRCETAEWALQCHLGYPPRPVDRHDVAQLCRAYGWSAPPGFA